MTAANYLAPPNCGRHRDTIVRWEQSAAEVFTTGSRAQARAALAEAQVFCGGCPIRVACEEQAASERYTGVAGGQIFVEGRRRSRPTKPVTNVA